MADKIVRPSVWNTKVDNGAGGIASGGEPPYDDYMDERVKRLEEFVGEARTELRGIDVRLTKIESRLDQTATKSDVSDAINAQIKWVVGTALVLGATAITVMTFVLNNAVPKAAAAPAAQPQPVVIYAQPAPAPQEPAPAQPSAK